MLGVEIRKSALIFLTKNDCRVVMGSFGAPELIIIFLVVLLVFGAKRIPEIARGLGKGIREFKSATKDITNELNIEDSVNRIDSPRQPAQGTPAPRRDESHQVQAEQQQAAPASAPPAAADPNRDQPG